MIILDVRSRQEFDAGHVPGALHIPFWAVPHRIGRLGVPRDTAIVVYCGHGPRAWMAKGLLKLRGFHRVSCMAGHMRQWKRDGKPLE